jgi:hypothetical protein
VPSGCGWGFRYVADLERSTSIAHRNAMLRPWLSSLPKLLNWEEGRIAEIVVLVTACSSSVQLFPNTILTAGMHNPYLALR